MARDLYVIIKKTAIIGEHLSAGSVVDQYYGPMADATEYAFMLAQEHAERLNVEAIRTIWGGHLLTNNKTLVIYAAC